MRTPFGAVGSGGTFPPTPAGAVSWWMQSPATGRHPQRRFKERGVGVVAAQRLQVPTGSPSRNVHPELRPLLLAEESQNCGPRPRAVRSASPSVGWSGKAVTYAPFPDNPTRGWPFARRPQHGVVVAGAAARSGVDARSGRARVRAGRLHRVHQGVYAVGTTSAAPRAAVGRRARHRRTAEPSHARPRSGISAVAQGPFHVSPLPPRGRARYPRPPQPHARSSMTSPATRHGLPVTDPSAHHHRPHGRPDRPGRSSASATAPHTSTSSMPHA